MNLNVNIILAPDDPEVTQSPDEIAHAILQALNGDVEKDVVSVFIHRPSAQMGTTAPAIPQMPPTEMPVPESIPPPPTQGQ